MPRKSDASNILAGDAQSQQNALLEAEGIESYQLPTALVTRIAKSAVSFDSLGVRRTLNIALPLNAATR